MRGIKLMIVGATLTIGAHHAHDPWTGLLLWCIGFVLMCAGWFIKE